MWSSSSSPAVGRQPGLEFELRAGLRRCGMEPKDAEKEAEGVTRHVFPSSPTASWKTCTTRTSFPPTTTPPPWERLLQSLAAAKRARR